MPNAPRDRALEPSRSVGSGPSMAPLPIATAKPKFGGDPGFAKNMPGPNIDPGIIKSGPSRDIDPGFSKTLPSPVKPKTQPKPVPKTTTKKVG